MPASRLTRWILGVLSVVVLLGLGFVGGILAPTLRTPGNNSPEAGFARDMSTHHAQAVGMSMLEVRDGSNPAVVQLAYNIALGQQGEIGQMAVWLQDWHLGPNDTGRPMAWMPGPPVAIVNGLMPGMASVAQINQLTTDRGNASDILFCQLMLRHHEGGIHMVEGILQLTHNSQVRALAQSMLTNQQGEILELTTDLKTLGSAPLSS